MNILPTSGIASLAGTARAQAHATDAERRSPSAEAAVDPPIREVAEIEAGQKSHDRDADGRQLLEQPNDEAADTHDEHAHDENIRDEHARDSSGKDPSESAGNHLDFEA
ncbi:hypothetical protein [Candidatus Laterigemmans baculatus]|uniref:hypothetical protein n=1 Tax=Candidatus Laterigemmans baculatus TaxID=2770505 RepID=UPI0013DBA12E|nr:hypothetical protein [Candidatus Laterigemmans baculatus]